jgi:hypothetical protein
MKQSALTYAHEPSTLFLTTAPAATRQPSPSRLSVSVAPETLEGGSTRASLYSGSSRSNSISLDVCQRRARA